MYKQAIFSSVELNWDRSHCHMQGLLLCHGLCSLADSFHTVCYFSVAEGASCHHPHQQLAQKCPPCFFTKTREIGRCKKTTPLLFTHSFTAIVTTSSNLRFSSYEVCTVFIIQGLTFSYSEKGTSWEEIFQLNIYPQLSNYCTYIFLFCLKISIEVPFFLKSNSEKL